MSESEVTHWNWIRADELNPEVDAEPDEGERIDLGLDDTGGLGETTEKIQSASGSGNQTARDHMDVVDHMVMDDGEESAMDMFWKQEVESGKVENKSELDIFLQEEREKAADFDVLGWWKLNAPRFPILSSIARDVLVVPVSTVASKSAFSTGGRVLNVYRSCLTPKIVQGLICAQDWLRGSSDFNPTADMEEQAEFDNLALGNQI
ncbi:hypothetical protein COLO4_16324 [Corchorus olitorius]|uniref:HAT C-terminal dimerisation domain-containing protein n=1 Tax=Corchorus olitorius TaxID=93759 RepID=A0A1R3JHX9_9ROSI|nr:hypothetical protein COLO4_16324 [Corchorus olitorius]